MGQISEKELRDSIIATKKDVKLVSAAKNDRTNSPASLYNEFVKLPLERQRDIIIAVSLDHFVGAPWKIAFPLNNFSAAVLPEAVSAAAKALFFSRDGDSVREVIRAIKLYQSSPFLKQISAALGEAAETTGPNAAIVAEILTSPEIYGLIKSLKPSPVAEKLIQVIAKIASYTKDLEATMEVAKFLYARRYSSGIEEIASLVEEAIFLARDRKSVREILTGLSAGSIDAVLEREGERKKILSGVRDIAWKTKDSKAIRQYLESFL